MGCDARRDRSVRRQVTVLRQHIGALRDGWPLLRGGPNPYGPFGATPGWVEECDRRFVCERPTPSLHPSYRQCVTARSAVRAPTTWRVSIESIADVQSERRTDDRSTTPGVDKFIKNFKVFTTRLLIP